jgi:urease accessory protein
MPKPSLFSRLIVPAAASAGLALPAVLLAAPAEAHTFGAWGAGFPQGFLHPLLGLDHELAMVGVGFWAGQIGGRARWLVPLAFVAAMIVGGVLGLAGVTLPGVELGIGASILLLGILIALRSHLPLAVSMGSVAAFAIFHGMAHGAEAPEAAAPLLYCLGFILATAMLHAIGIGLAAGLEQARRLRLAPRQSDRLVGMATGLLGLGLLLDLWTA